MWELLSYYKQFLSNLAHVLGSENLTRRGLDGDPLFINCKPFSNSTTNRITDILSMPSFQGCFSSL